MARYQFEPARSGGDWVDQTAWLLSLVVRAFGFVLMIAGLWIGLSVIAQAWSLYRYPQNIERFVRAIEEGSNLDKALSAVGRSGNSSTAEHQDDAAGGDAARAGSAGANEPGAEFRLSYFAAWIIVLLLLMLIGRLAIAAVKTGGELALYDTQIKRFAQTLVREAARTTER